MFFKNTGEVYRKTRDANRVSTWVYQKDITCKLVFWLDNKTWFDSAPNFSTYRLFTRDTTILKHDKIIIDDVSYIVSAQAKYSGVGTNYNVYIVTIGNEDNN